MLTQLDASVIITLDPEKQATWSPRNPPLLTQEWGEAAA